MDERRDDTLLNFIVAFIVSLALFIPVYALCDVIFLTNDDLFLQMIVSGSISGTPDAHMIYSHVFLGKILSGLYSITKSVDWYTGVQVFGLFVCFFLSLLRLLKISKSWLEKTIVTIIFTGAVLLTCFRHFVELQYTVTATMLGVTAILYALTMQMDSTSRVAISFENVWDFVAVLGLVAASCLVREKALLMCVPFAGALWLAKWISQPEKTQEINFRFILLPILVAILVGGLHVADSLSYSKDPEWKAYKEYNHAREEVIDYDGFPNYENNAKLYEELEISKEEYEAAKFHYFLLPQKHITADTLNRIASYNKEVRIKGFPAIGNAIKAMIERTFDYTDRPLSVLVMYLWVVTVFAAIFMIFKENNPDLLLHVLLLFVARSGVWFYLFYKGRTPDRVTQGLYYAELVLLILFLLDAYHAMPRSMTNNKRVLRVFLYSTCLGGLAVCLYMGIPKIKSYHEDVSAKTYFGSSLHQLMEYTGKNSDNIYFVEMNSLASFSKADFKVDTPNMIMMGSWLPGSPLIQEALEKYEITDVTNPEQILNKKNLYWICKDSEVTNLDYVTLFYQSAGYETEAVQVGTINTDCGISFGIYELKIATP